MTVYEVSFTVNYTDIIGIRESAVSAFIAADFTNITDTVNAYVKATYGETAKAIIDSVIKNDNIFILSNKDNV